MTYTYKLDQKGIPYRVPQPERAGQRKEKQEPQPEKDLLRHGGKLERFQLYVF